MLLALEPILKEIRYTTLVTTTPFSFPPLLTPTSLIPPSNQIPILRIQIPQLRLFVLGQAHICDRLFPFPILRHTSYVISYTADDAQTCKCNANRIALCVERRIGFEETVDCDDAADVAERDLEG